MSLKAILYFSITLYFWYKALKNPIYGIAFFAAIVFIRPETVTYRQLQFLKIPFTTSLICMFSYLVHKRRLDQPVNSKLGYMLIGYSALGYLSTFFSEVHPLWRWPGDLAKIMVFCFLISKIIIDIRSLDIFILSVLIGVGFLAVWGVDQHFQGNVRLEGVGGDRFSSNEFGSILGMMFPFFLYKARGFISIFPNGIKKKSERLFFLIGIFFLLATIQFTNSRGAFLGLCAGIMVLILRSEHLLRTISMSLIIVVIIFPFVPGAYKTRIATIFNPSIALEGDSSDFESQEVDGSITGRIDFWKGALSMTSDYPFIGVGLQNSELLMRHYTQGYDRSKDVHNMYFKVLAELGGVGFSTLISIIALSFVYLKKTRKLCMMIHDKKIFYYQAAIEASLVSFLVSALTGSYMYSEPFYWVIILTGSVYMLSLKASASPKTSNFRPLSNDIIR